jgi:hypothetical protein
MERTLKKGQQGLEISDWTAREDTQHIKARIGKERTGRPEHDSI